MIKNTKYLKENKRLVTIFTISQNYRMSQHTMEQECVDTKGCIFRMHVSSF
jgi:hypothetical protein